MKKNLFLIFFFIINVQAFAQNLDQNLEKLYRANPGLITQLNLKILQAEATKALKDEALAKSIAASLKEDLDLFMKSRSSVIQNLGFNPVTASKRFVVSGQSVTGMVAAAIAAQSGHPVSVYDLRLSYNREIQWSTRQAVLDLLSSIDPKLAERFSEETATNVTRGYMSIDVDGTKVKNKAAFMVKADPRRIPQDASTILNARSVATVQVKKFEKLLYEYLSQHPNVTQVKGKIEIGPLDPITNRHTVTEFEDVTLKGQKEKVYKEISKGQPYTLIAEGSASSSRSKLNIESVATSPKRLQIAGVIEVENGGEIVAHSRAEGPGKMITSSMGTTGSGQRWVVADIDEEKIIPDKKKFGIDSSRLEFQVERQRLLEKEFKRLAALNMRMNESEVSKLKAWGAIEGKPLHTFELQQRISSKAASGSNVLLLADAVGSGHWNVGGGMHIGAVSHAERLKQFLTAVDGGTSPHEAAKAYSAGAIKDSRVWGEQGLHYFYNNLSHEEATKAYREAVELYYQGKVSTPERALELMLPGGRSSRTVKSIRLDCKDIVKYVLGEI